VHCATCSFSWVVISDGTRTVVTTAAGLLVDMKTPSYLTVAISAPTPPHPRWWRGPRPRGWWAQEGEDEPGHWLSSVQHRMYELTVHFIGCGAAVEATWGHAWVPCERVLS
jgi:hypothetical protein